MQGCRCTGWDRRSGRSPVASSTSLQIHMNTKIMSVTCCTTGDDLLCVSSFFLTFKCYLDHQSFWQLWPNFQSFPSPRGSNIKRLPKSQMMSTSGGAKILQPQYALQRVRREVMKPEKLKDTIIKPDPQPWRKKERCDVICEIYHLLCTYQLDRRRFRYINHCKLFILNVQIKSGTEKVGEWYQSIFEVTCTTWWVNTDRKTIAVDGRREIALDVTQFRGVLAGYLTGRGGA